MGYRRQDQKWATYYKCDVCSHKATDEKLAKEHQHTVHIKGATHRTVTVVKDKSAASRFLDYVGILNGQNRRYMQAT